MEYEVCGRRINKAINKARKVSLSQNVGCLDGGLGLL